MTTAKKTIKGLFNMSLATAIGQAASFIRNIILARLLTPADFGIAALFAMAIMLFDLTSKSSAGTLVVQSKDGNDDKFLHSLYFYLFTLGAGSSIALILLSGKIAAVFDFPEDAIQYINLLAAIPLFKSLEHLDTRRYTRELRYLPHATVEAVPQTVSTLAAFPVALWLGDYRAIIVLAILKGFTSLVLTHSLAERKYRWGFEKNHLSNIASFTWPLLLNGFLMFAIMQGDKLLVGSFYKLQELGVYAAAALLAFTPTSMLAQINAHVSIPILAKKQNNNEQFRATIAIYLGIISLVAVIFGSTLIIAGDLIINLIYGDKYVDGGMVLASLAAVNALRILRFGSTAAALSKGDTKNSLLSSLFRGGGLIFTFIAALIHQPLWVIALSAAIGEFMALLVSFRRLNKKSYIPLQIIYPSFLYVIIMLSAAGISVKFLIAGTNALWAMPAVAVFWALSFAFHASYFCDCRKLLLRSLKSLIYQRKRVAA